MELGHLLTRSGLAYPEVSSKVCHDSFCQLGNSVSLHWVIYCETFYLHVSSFFIINDRKPHISKNESITTLLLMPYATIIGVTTLKGFIVATKIKVSLMKNCSIYCSVYPHNTGNINYKPCTYCVTLMRVRETIVAVEKQYYIF